MDRHRALLILHILYEEVKDEDQKKALRMAMKLVLGVRHWRQVSSYISSFYRRLNRHLAH